MEKSFLCVSKNTMQITSIPGCILDIRDFSFLLLFESSIGWLKRENKNILSHEMKEHVMWLLYKCLMEENI